MQKFNKALRGYDIDEVNSFLDKVIFKVEQMVTEMKKKDEEIERLKVMEVNYNSLKMKNNNYERMEETLKRAILMAEKTSEQIKLTAHREREVLISDAKVNANRIVNEALLKSENIDRDTEKLKRNLVSMKRKLRDILEAQLEFVDSIEKIDIE